MLFILYRQDLPCGDVLALTLTGTQAPAQEFLYTSTDTHRNTRTVKEIFTEVLNA